MFKIDVIHFSLIFYYIFFIDTQKQKTYKEAEKCETNKSNRV